MIIRILLAMTVLSVISSENIIEYEEYYDYYDSMGQKLAIETRGLEVITLEACRVCCGLVRDLGLWVGSQNTGNCNTDGCNHQSCGGYACRMGLNFRQGLSPEFQVDSNGNYISYTCQQDPKNVSSAFVTAVTTSPTLNPTTTAPTKFPTAPTVFVSTAAPTLFPTTLAPTKFPSSSPTGSPVRSPTRSPSTSPPTKSPTQFPTLPGATNSPSKSPSTSSPTKNPTHFPTIPGATKSPSKSPVKEPTETPSVSPTRFPSDLTSDSPTSFEYESNGTAPTTVIIPGGGGGGLTSNIGFLVGVLGVSACMIPCCILIMVPLITDRGRKKEKEKFQKQKQKHKKRNAEEVDPEAYDSDGRLLPNAPLVLQLRNAVWTRTQDALSLNPKVTVLRKEYKGQSRNSLPVPIPPQYVHNQATNFAKGHVVPKYTQLDDETAETNKHLSFDGYRLSQAHASLKLTDLTNPKAEAELNELIDQHLLDSETYINQNKKPADEKTNKTGSSKSGTWSHSDETSEITDYHEEFDHDPDDL